MTSGFPSGCSRSIATGAEKIAVLGHRLMAGGSRQSERR